MIPVPKNVFMIPTKMNFQNVRSNNCLIFIAFSSAGVSNNIPRSAFDFLIDSGNVVSNNAKADHNDTAGKQLNQNYGCKSFQSLSADFLKQCNTAENNRNNKHDYAKHGNNLHWCR